MRSTWQAWSYLIILAAGKMLRKTAGESSSAIETWLAGKSIWNGGLNGKSILNWVRFHCNVWLPEGTEWVWSKMLCTGRRSYTTRPDTKRSDTSQKLRCTLNLQGDPFKSGRNNSQAHGSWHVLLLTFGDHLQTSSDSRNSKAASMTCPCCWHSAPGRKYSGPWGFQWLPGCWGAGLESWLLWSMVAAYKNLWNFRISHGE